MSVEKIDFSSILASSIHDMKNSLGIVLSSLDELISESSSNEKSGKFSKLQFEAKRVNNNLIQLLSLYKMQNTGLAANIDEYPVYAFLEECVLYDQPILESRSIKVDIDCPASLRWYFDKNLIAGVIGNGINNAISYTSGNVLVSAAEEDDYLVIRVNDDGAGYPDTMKSVSDREVHGVSFSSGDTGLGLYFSTLVAELHKNKQKKGYIELANGFKLGGACFTVYLP